MKMRELISIIETTGSKHDPRFQYHMSVEPNLIPGMSFAHQTKTSHSSEAGRRGDAFDGDGSIYTTLDLFHWSSQLTYEIPKKQFETDFPHYVYLVFVRNGENGSIWAAHQNLSNPDDVIVLTKIGETDPDPDSTTPDYGKMIWVSDKWIKQHGEAAITKYS